MEWCLVVKWDQVKRLQGTDEINSSDDIVNH